MQFYKNKYGSLADRLAESILPIKDLKICDRDIVEEAEHSAEELHPVVITTGLQINAHYFIQCWLTLV